MQLEAAFTDGDFAYVNHAAFYVLGKCGEQIGPQDVRAFRRSRFEFPEA